VLAKGYYKYLLKTIMPLVGMYHNLLFIIMKISTFKMFKKTQYEYKKYNYIVHIEI